MKIMNVAIGMCGLALAAAAAGAWDLAEVEKLDAGAKVAVAEMLENDPDMKRFFDSSVAHVVIPTVAKAGVGIGGARGTGLLYEGGKPTAIVTLSQLSIGFQWGGQPIANSCPSRTPARWKNSNAATSNWAHRCLPLP